MASLEETILAPVSPEDPCGPNLEYDAAFAAFDRISQGKPEQQVGNTIVAAEDPDWKVVQKQATELLARSKDIRVAYKLMMALTKLRAWPGFADGIAVMRGMVERYWDGFHPRLDPDDNNDPTMRVNIIMGLTEPDVLTVLRMTTLVASRAVGKFTLRDLEIATGDAPAPAEGTPPQFAAIEAALMDCDLAELEQTAARVRATQEGLTAMEAFITDQVGAGQAPNLSKLVAVVRRVATFLSGGVERRQGGGADAGGDGGGDGAGEAGGGGGGGRPARRGGALSGEISSREDVTRALDKICEYYAQYEPSSPIPMFMQRCKKLVTMSFIDIVRDLVPEAVDKVETLKGRSE